MNVLILSKYFCNNKKKLEIASFFPSFLPPFLPPFFLSLFLSFLFLSLFSSFLPSFLSFKNFLKNSSYPKRPPGGESQSSSRAFLSAVPGSREGRKVPLAAERPLCATPEGRRAPQKWPRGLVLEDEGFKGGGKGRCGGDE